MTSVIFLEGIHVSTLRRIPNDQAILFPNSLTQLYMDMIDRGWRRSGEYLYKPDMKRTCCPQYTIRLDASEFSPSRSQRQISNRWNRFVLDGNKQEKGMVIEASKSKLSGKSTPPFDLIQAVHGAENHDDLAISAHRFEVTLEPSTYTDEKFALYQRYQQDVHKESDKRRSSFERFLVNSPLSDDETIPYQNPNPPDHLPRTYGSYHQCYRFDGELFAIGVLDILPGCVSSVYFMYDKKFEKYSPGKLSALREVALAREIRTAGLSSMHSLYMGFYVHTCPKMQYKGEYSPSYLLDPEEYTWYPFKKCTELLSQHRYVCFTRPDEYLDEDPGPGKVPDYSEDELNDVYVYIPEARTFVPVTTSPTWKDDDSRELILKGVENFGFKIIERVVFMVEQ